MHSIKVGPPPSRARAGGGPSLLECKVNRYYGHEEGDSQLYRRPNEVEEIRATRDCLDQMSSRLLARDEVTEAELAQIDAEARTLIDEAVDGARAGQMPEAAELLTDVYVSY